MTDQQDAIDAACRRFYGIHQPQHLSRDVDIMVDRCVNHIMGRHGLSLQATTDHARRVLGDLQRGGVPAFVNCDRSTSSLVVLRDTEQQRDHYLTVPELLQLARSRDQAPGAG